LLFSGATPNIIANLKQALAVIGALVDHLPDRTIADKHATGRLFRSARFLNSTGNRAGVSRLRLLGESRGASEQ
jgi:hypothetical protein